MVTYTLVCQMSPVRAFRKKTPISVREVRKKSAGFVTSLLCSLKAHSFTLLEKSSGPKLLMCIGGTGKSLVTGIPSFHIQANYCSLYTLSPKILIKHGHQILLFTVLTIYMLTGYAQMLGCDALMGGRPPAEPADWGRPHQDSAAGRRRKREEGEEEGERKVLSQQHEWIRTEGGEKGNWQVRGFEGEGCKHKADEGMKTFMWADSAEWVTHETKYEVGLKDWQWRKIWKHGCVQC